jgi:GntR family transcriptional regulator, transcriptional repressor for pyruvate dehydrogenase complex
MRFTTVQKQKAYVNIAQQVIESIKSGGFKIGDKLPSARELETMFGVSKPTVREALSALELAGVVKIRTGQGAYVVGIHPEDVRESPEFRLDQGESPSAVMDVRLVLEPEGARLAAERGSREDVAALRPALAKLEEEMRQQKAGITGDISFHVAVAKASGNAVIHKVMRGLAHYLNQSLWHAMRREAWGSKSDLGTVYLQQHRATLEAIEAHEGQRAARAMLEHLVRVQEDLFPDQ